MIDEVELQDGDLAGTLRRGAVGEPEGAGPEPGAAEAARRFSERAGAERLADISYAVAESPFGPLLVASTRRGLVRLAFPEEDPDGVLERLALRVSPRIVQSAAPLDPVRRELEEYFAGGRRRFDLTVDWSLVGRFGRRVLGATSEIPYGGVLSFMRLTSLNRM